jgi:phosphatidate cytidylyltransferase
MSNTQQRIASALVLSSIVAFTIFLGVKATITLFGIVSVVAIDEIICNFFNRKRFSLHYVLSEVFFIVPYVYIFFVCNSLQLNGLLIYGSIALNLFLIFYLFFVEIESKLLHKTGQFFPEISSLLLLFPLIALSTLTFYPEWRMLLATILLVNFGMDTGAWLFGKNFGKHKLWKKVSPNKTIEGLLGGMFTSGLVGCIAWQGFFGGVSPLYFVLFAFLGAMSQVGDLIQSKIKRQVGVKDSSSLIPGHGGVYDRIDSLIFLAPFFIMVLKLIYNK